MTDFDARARKYTGKILIEGGPVPIQVWKDRDRQVGPKGRGLRGELPSPGKLPRGSAPK
jgi:hypothetical protein